MATNNRTTETKTERDRHIEMAGSQGSSDRGIDVEKTTTPGNDEYVAMQAAEDAVVTAKTWAVVIVSPDDLRALYAILILFTGTSRLVRHIVLARTFLQHNSNRTVGGLWVCFNDGNMVCLPLQMATYNSYANTDTTRLTSVYSMGGTIAFLVCGANSDLFGRRTFILAGNILVLIGTILGATSHTIGQSITAHVFLGFGGGNCQLAAFALPELLPNKWRHFAVVMADSVVYFDVIIAPVVARIAYAHDAVSGCCLS